MLLLPAFFSVGEKVIPSVQKVAQSCGYPHLYYLDVANTLPVIGLLMCPLSH